MTKTFKVTMILLLGSGVLCAGADQYKMYGVESGKIDYKISGSGNIMGVKTKVVGKKRILFKAYGVKSLTEKNEVRKTVMGGKSNIEKSHKLTCLDGAILYNADMEKKRITRMQNPAIAMMGALGGGKSPMEMGEAMLKQMGGKKIGTDKVLGYTCNVWEMVGTKQCIYKGIPLKTESNVMGIKNTEVATKAEFDISISNEDLKLPDFPIYDMYGKKVDKTDLAKLDEKEKREAEQGAEEMAAAMSAVTAAAKSAGIKPGEKPTVTQEKAMENAMMAAMFPRMKQKIIDEEKMMLEARACFGNADTLKEAKACSRNMDEGEDDGLKEWNDKTKRETLTQIDKALTGMACAKKAENMDQIRNCMK